MLLKVSLLLVLFTVADGMPVSSDPTSLSGAQSAIHDAQESLQGMEDDENKELHEMQQVKTAITSLPDSKPGHETQEQAAVLRVTSSIENEENQAIQQEKDQQSAALAGLKKVNSAIGTLTQGFKKRLGEQQTPQTDSGVQHALKKLQEVSTTLARGTKTSNTMHRIERMKAETETLNLEAAQASGEPSGFNGTPDNTQASAPPGFPKMAPPDPNHELGESGDEGALSALSRATAPTGSNVNAEEGALSALSHAAPQPMPQPAAQPTLVQQETQELKHLLAQEGQVEAAEKADESEVGTLLKKLG